jgi:hypothetical protein
VAIPLKPVVPRADGRFPKLLLKEQTAVRLPSGPVRGVNATKQGYIVTWPAAGHEIWVMKGTDTASVVFAGVTGIVAAALDTGGAAVDAVVTVGNKSGLVNRLLGGTRSQSQIVALPVRVEVAVPFEDDWCFVGWRPNDSRVQLNCIARKGGIIAHVTTLEMRDTTARFRMTSGPGVLLICRSNAPFDTWVVQRQSGRLVRHFQPSSMARVSTPTTSDGRTRPRWFAAATVALDSGYVQTLADARSDDRMLILFDRSGAEIRQTRVSVSMAFVGVDQTRHELLAVRNSGVNELVWYSWAWQ